MISCPRGMGSRCRSINIVGTVPRVSVLCGKMIEQAEAPLATTMGFCLDALVKTVQFKLRQGPCEFYLSSLSSVKDVLEIHISCGIPASYDFLSQFLSSQQSCTAAEGNGESNAVSFLHPSFHDCCHLRLRHCAGTPRDG